MIEPLGTTGPGRLTARGAVLGAVAVAIVVSAWTVRLPLGLDLTKVMLIFVGATALLLATIWVVTSHEPRVPLGFAVGVTGALQTAQIAGLHLFCVVVLFWLVFGVARERRGWPRFEWPALLMMAATLLASSALTGDLVNNQLLAGQLLVLAGAAACLVAFGDRTDVRSMINGVLATTTVASAAGILQYLRILPHELFLGQDRPIGLYTEPDWLGMFSAVGLVIAFNADRSRLRTALVLINLLSLLLAAARAAWVAVVVVAVVGYLATRLSRTVSRGRPRSKGGIRVLVAAGMCGVVLLLVNPTLRDFLASRIEGTGEYTRDVAANARVQQIEALLNLQSQAPWHGLGLSASGRVNDSGLVDYLGTSPNNVASNWILGWWADGKLLAIPIILVLLAAAVRRPATTAGQVLLTVLVSSLFSNATFIPIAWLALALSQMVGSATSAARGAAASSSVG